MIESTAGQAEVDLAAGFRISVPYPLGLLGGADLPDLMLERLRKLENYDLWFLEDRLLGKGRINPDLLPLAVFEFRRFIALIVLDGGGLSMLSPEVDEVWHEFILFTREYCAFCAAVAGDYIHHSPVTGRAGHNRERADRFRRLYKERFGPLDRELYAGALVNTTDDGSICQDGCETPEG